MSRRAVGVLAVVLTAYELSARWHPYAPWEPGWSALDRRLPFVEAAFYVYASYYALLAGGLLALDGADLERTSRQVLLATASASAFFFLVPISLPPGPVPVGAGARLIFGFLMEADTSANTFPSLHVALALIIGCSLARAKPSWGRLGPAWACAVAVSTVLTKRHFAADVAGGVALAWACLAAVR